MKFKVGFGYDVHQLKDGLEFYLGGIKISHSKGALGHSDADVLLHAICDALLGAANLRDIGFHFPDSSTEFKNIDSKLLLRNVNEQIKAKGFAIGNIDSTICLQQPKISCYIDEMKKSISNTIGIDIEDISIKATTTEKMGFVGKQKGVSAYAVVLIYSIL